MSLRIVEPHYYLYPEDDMPESQAQLDLAGYLTNLLSEQFDVKDHFVTGNLEIRPSEAMKCPFKAIVPDVAVFKGCVLTPQERLTLSSWDMSRANRPAPQVVFEIASENTWRHDLDNKPDDYRLLGVKEYFAYDPVGFWQRGGRGMSRLRGWRYIDGKTQEIKPDEQGRLFSEELDSYLVEDGGYLRLYDRQGNRRLTKTEAAQAARDQAQTARDQAQAARDQAQAARDQAQAARESIEQLVETERQRADRLARRLRELGYDPDEI